jgi:hypothetical protein
VQSSIIRLEKKYDELLLWHAKNLQKDEDETVETVTTEYVVATQAVGYVADWVPVGQLCLARRSDHDADESCIKDLLTAAVSMYCRELSHVASMGSKVFQSVPNTQLQWSVEPVDSYYKHVHDAAKGKQNDASSESSMTKLEARSELEIPLDLVDLKEIKQVYRKLSFKWHPDRFVGQEQSNDDAQAASDRYARIKLAFETLSSGTRDQGKSWYESLGGKSRTDFMTVKLQSIASAEAVFETFVSTNRKVETGMCRLDPDTVQSFVARSKA